MYTIMPYNAILIHRHRGQINTRSVNMGFVWRVHIANGAGDAFDVLCMFAFQ